MSLTALAIICLLTQLCVVAAVFYFLRSAGRRPNLVRGIGVFLFVCLESAIIFHLILARAGRMVEIKDVFVDIALVALIALAFGFGRSLLNLLHHSRRALEHSENLSSTLFEQSSEPVIMLDQSSNLLEVNGAACEQLGFSRNELFKLRMSDIVHPDELMAVSDRLSNMIPGDIERIPIRVRKKDGSWMQTDTSSRRLNDGTYLTIARDITAQTRQQRSLERFAEVSSGTGDQFFTSVAQSLSESLDLEHVLIGELIPGQSDRVRSLAVMLDMKPAANIEYDLAGTPCNTVVGRAIACYPSSLQEMFPDDAMLVEIGAVSYIGTPLFASNGAPLGLICALSRSPITDQSHCRTVLACYSRRIESEIERMRAEAALRESEERYSNVVNVSPFGMHMYRLENDGRLILEAANPAADWLLGLDHSKLIGKTIEEAFPSLAHTEVPEQYRRIAAHGERWRNESVTYRDNRIDGAFEVVAFQRSPMKMAALFMNITDRKQAEEALRDSEAGLANAQRITHIGSWSLDPLNMKSVWSSEMYRICGLNPKERPPLFDEYVDNIVHPEDRSSVRTTFEGLLKGRIHQPIDYRIIRPDGSIRICQAQSTVEFSSTGQPVRISGTTQDITERRSAEQALRSSEERYRNFVANASEGIFRVEFTQPIRIDDPADVIADRVTRYAVVSEVNEVLASIYRLSPEEMTGQPVRRFAPECGAHLVELLNTPDYRITDHEVTSCAGDGTLTHTVESYFGIVENGQLIRVWGVERDVTDRKQAEEKLQLMSQRLSLATQGARVGIWDYDIASHQMFWNPMMYELYGLSPELTTDPMELWQAAVHPQDFLPVDAGCKGLIDKGGRLIADFRIVWPDGSIHQISVNAVAHCDTAGKPVRIVGTNWDITERKQAEEMLRRQNEFLVALRESTLDLVSEPDLDRLLESILKRAGQLVGTSSGFIDLLEPGADRLTPRIALGCLAKDSLKYAVQRGEGITGKAWQTGRPVVVDDYDTWPDRISGCETDTVRAMVAMPLVAKSGVVGVIGLAHERSCTRVFDTESVERLNEFARFAALAIEGAQLNKAVRRELAEREREIAERRLAEDALMRSEERWQFALEGAGDGVWDWNAQTDQVFFSRRWKEMLGYDENEIGDSLAEWDQRVHPDDKALVYAAIERHFAGETPVYVSEHRVRCKDGNYKWILDRGKVIQRTADGKPLRVIGTHTDITAQKQVEKELQRSLSLVRATLESTTDGILVVDYHGNVAGYNQKFLEHWRIPATLAEQNDDARLITYVLDQLKDPDGFVRKVQELYANPSAESFDLLEFKDGRHVERYSLPQRMGDEIIGRVWSFRDITERKRAELERIRLEEQLRLSQKLETIGTLAAGIAHDFNNLLVPVIGYTELADSDRGPKDPGHEYLAEVLKAAYRAKSLVGQILAFSRQQSGESRLVRLESVVDEAARLLRSSLDPNIILETIAESGLPQLFADATQLHQVIMNLGVNAAHAMKTGGHLTLTVKATSSDAANCCVCGCQLFGKHLELCVADTGGGMDQATLRRIFDPFFTTKPVGEGTGLGLAVTHGIVAHHGGHICAQSQVGVGTSFHIYLPAVEESEAGRLPLNTERTLAATHAPVS